MLPIKRSFLRIAKTSQKANNDVAEGGIFVYLQHNNSPCFYLFKLRYCIVFNKLSSLAPPFLGSCRKATEGVMGCIKHTVHESSQPRFYIPLYYCYAWHSNRFLYDISSRWELYTLSHQLYRKQLPVLRSAALDPAECMRSRAYL